MGREGGKNGKMTGRNARLNLPVPYRPYCLTGICINKSIVH